MNIAQIIRSNTSGSLTSAQTPTQTSTQAASSASPVSQAMKKVDARIQSQLDTTSAQLSAFGKLKSSVSDAQLSAHALSGLSANTSAADIKTAAARFVASFNTALAAAKTTAAVPGAATAPSVGAGRFSRELGRTFSADTATMDALKKIGFKQLADGSLTLDTAKLDAAQKADPAGVIASLAKLGQGVDKATTHELATGGGVSDAMASLNQRTAALKTQQKAMLTLVQNLATTQNTSSFGYGNYGLSAYKSSY
jgi:hypothetical protein